MSDKKEIWRVYPEDVALIHLKSGKVIKVTMSEDRSHAIVEFDKGLYKEQE